VGRQSKFEGALDLAAVANYPGDPKKIERRSFDINWNLEASKLLRAGKH